MQQTIYIYIYICIYSYILWYYVVSAHDMWGNWKARSQRKVSGNGGANRGHVESRLFRLFPRELSFFQCFFPLRQNWTSNENTWKYRCLLPSLARTLSSTSVCSLHALRMIGLYLSFRPELRVCQMFSAGSTQTAAINKDVLNHLLISCQSSPKPWCSNLKARDIWD